MKHKQLLGLLALVALLLAACVTQTPETGSPLVLTSTLPQPKSPLSQPPTPAAPAGAPANPLDDLRARVAQDLGLKATDLTLVSSEEVQWRDSSLGCPREGMNYLQVITPGWRIIFADAAGKQYDIRAPEAMNHYILCPNEADAASMPPVDTASFGSAKEAAANALMEKLNVSRTAVSVVSIEAVRWRNSCLGCAIPDERCLLVVTPGYRIQLKSGGKSYTVHTDSAGSRAIVCENPDADGALKP
jgi:hypothetical protein